MAKESSVKMHVTIDKEMMQLLSKTAKCFEKVNKLLQLNSERLLKALKRSFKAVQ